MMSCRALTCWITLLLSFETNGFVPQYNNYHRNHNVFSISSSSSIRRTLVSSVRAAATSSVINSGGSITNVQSPQLLEFREPQTNVTVLLVGAMHYNPTSVQLAQDTVVDLGVSGRLGSVVVESCDLRWNKTGELTEESALVKNLLTNEMRTASDAAEAFDRPVVLGDQRINVTVDALKAGLSETLGDLVLRPRRGWPRIASNLSRAAAEALPEGDEDYLGPLGLFDSRLLMAAPISLIKYPLSYFFRSPLLTLLFFTVVSADLWANTLGARDANAMMMDGSGTGLGDVIFSLTFAALETLVFARLLLKELLAERNEILAKNILEQCRIYAKSNNSSTNAFSTIFSSILPQKMLSSSSSLQPEIVYADKFGSSLELDDSPAATALREKIALFETRRKQQQIVNGGSAQEEEKVVVAILGMAHCNGIMKLLKEQSIA